MNLAEIFRALLCHVILYTSDIHGEISKFPNVSLFEYADDCKLSVAYNKDNAFIRSFELQCALETVARWSENNQLSLSAEKCTHLQLGPRSPSLQPNYWLNGRMLAVVDQQRDLGVQVVPSFRRSASVDDRVKKSSQGNTYSPKSSLSQRPCNSDPLLQNVCSTPS